mgnify:CR=1 FL=1
MKYQYSEIKNSFHDTEPWVNVFVLKYITLPLVYLMVNYTRITPNIISFISLFLGVLSAFFYFIGFELEASFMYICSYIFDATDGKVARITGKGKVYGAWLDTFVDRLNLVLISLAISYNHYELYGSISFLLLNNLFLGLAFIGWESRYNIDYYILSNNISQCDKNRESKYSRWCKRHGVIKEPISLPELFLFYFVFISHFSEIISVLSLIMIVLFLILRLIKQQFFWKDVSC